nr:hypothetical protein [Tanacetum cinerariifolium]
MEILLEPTSNKLMFSISIGETVTHWFILIVLSALRRFDNENMLSLMNLILRLILTDLQAYTYYCQLKVNAARVDGKEIIITESFVRRDLRLADEDGVDYLPNSTIFENLELMGCQEAMRDTIAQTRFENVSKLSNDSLLARARVDSSENEQSLREDASIKGGKIHDIDADEDITLVNDQDDAEIFDVTDLHGEEVFVEKELAVKDVIDEV